MNQTSVINQLEHNGAQFMIIFSGLSSEMYTWKNTPEKWCILEILCHLYDEERFDFKARINHILKHPNKPMEPIDPIKWVTEHKYMQQDFKKTLALLMEERSNSIKWLHALENPKWENEYLHPQLGKMTASMLLANWLAHDYLHFRQITSVKYQYLQAHTNESLSYAGNW